MNNTDIQYTNLLRDILDNGYPKDTRSGRVRSVFSRTMRFNLKDGIPLLTTKKVFYKGIIEELLWFISGSTNIKPLVEKDVHIWDDDAYRYYKELVEVHNKIATTTNAHRCSEEVSYSTKVIFPKDAFLQKVLKGEKDNFLYSTYGYCREYTFGDLGNMYGRNWRRFGESGIDQIQGVIDLLKNDPDSRRILLTCYDPDTVDDAALYPCHIMYQFYCKEIPFGLRLCNYINTYSVPLNMPSETELDAFDIPKYKLSCSFICRSQDVPLGTPFNIASAAFLTYMLAEICNMEPDELIWIGQDCHIYENQFEGVEEQLTRNGNDILPRLKFRRKINDINDFKYEDFEIIGYNPDPHIKFPLSVG